MLCFYYAISILIWATFPVLVPMDDIERIQRRISLHDMRVFISVVQARSMGKAAIRLATSQPAVSRSIAQLEKAIGVRLLERSPQGIEPTGYGRALLRRGIAVFDEIAQGDPLRRIQALRVAGAMDHPARLLQQHDEAANGNGSVCHGFELQARSKRPGRHRRGRGTG